DGQRDRVHPRRAACRESAQQERQGGRGGVQAVTGERTSPARRQQLPQQSQRRLHLRRRQAQRRAEAGGAFAPAQQQQAAVEGRLDQLIAQGGGGLPLARLQHVKRLHQPQPAHVADERGALLEVEQTAAQLLAAFGDIAQILLLQKIERGQGSPAT